MICAAVVVGAGVAGVAETKAGATEHTEKVVATFYGWWTNTPPGCATADSNIKTGCAGGKGTYTTPITSAVDPSEPGFAYGTIFYYPTLEKYFIAGDSCTECTTTYKDTGTARMDLWMGGSTTATAGTAFALVDCEDALTVTLTGVASQTTFIVTPPAGLTVSSTPLFTGASGRCFNGAVSPVTFDRYVNATDGKCIENPGYGTTAGVAAELAPCTATNKGEDLEFSGAWFFNHGLCLDIDTTTRRTTSALKWTTCTETKTGELFEQTGHHTIGWIEYARCVGLSRGTLKMGSCSSTSKADMWTKVVEPPVGLPSGPGKPTATRGNKSATVRWSASATHGSFTIRRYTVTSSPGGRFCLWTSGPLTCTVRTLTNATAYTFTVTAWSIAGTSPASPASTPVIPTSTYRGDNLKGETLAGTTLADADLQGANLKGANLRGADIQGADLQGDNLQGADLQRADLAGATLAGANLQGSNLPDTNLDGADLRGDNLQGAHLTADTLQSADLRGDNLQGASLATADLRGATLKGSNLQKADLADANLMTANLTGANLQTTNLTGATLTGAKLTGANTHGVIT